jgi:hypothetical protein
MSIGLGEIVLYQTADAGPALDVQMERESVWLEQLGQLRSLGRGVGQGLNLANLTNPGFAFIRKSKQVNWGGATVP